jgi:NTP pyrophosphatase (non-canonical NTP hydrolase)
MELSEYQKDALETDLSDKRSPEGLLIAALGLVSEVGSIANVIKKDLRDGISRTTRTDFLKTELGDALWYLSNVASRLGLSLDEIAKENLVRTRDRHGTKGSSKELPAIARLDGTDLETERFPERLLFYFHEILEGGKPRVHMTLKSAEPNPFPAGALIDSPTGKRIGFTLGDPLTNNAHEDDLYRYHDAFHIGFLAVLGWSPVLRDLLRLKRKSRPDIDDSEDGQRACDAEEGITSWLRQRAPKFGEFQMSRYVDNETLDYILEHVKGLEVNRRPSWMWKDAISEGFRAWKSLSQNGGGYLLADLSQKTVTYSRLEPNPDSVPDGRTIDEASKQP